LGLDMGSDTDRCWSTPTAGEMGLLAAAASSDLLTWHQVALANIRDDFGINFHRVDCALLLIACRGITAGRKGAQTSKRAGGPCARRSIFVCCLHLQRMAAPWKLQSFGESGFVDEGCVTSLASRRPSFCSALLRRGCRSSASLAANDRAAHLGIPAHIILLPGWEYGPACEHVNWMQMPTVKYVHLPSQMMQEGLPSAAGVHRVTKQTEQGMSHSQGD
jgi:hypothetical protein